MRSAHLHRWISIGGCIILASLVSVASADDRRSPDARDHVLIGLLPSAEFEVTCDDSIVHAEPVLSDALGIASFTVDLRDETPPNVFCVRVPAPPVISQTEAIGVTDCDAVVRWETDRPSTSLVEYGTSLAFEKATQLSEHLTTSHAVLLTGLSPETTYYARVVSRDAFGGFETTSAPLEFVTDRPSLVILEVSVTGVTSNSITLEWTTDRPSMSWLEYGLDTSCNSATAVDTVLTTEHEVTVGGLSANTAYYVRACSADEQFKTASSNEQLVTTELPPLGAFGVSVADTTATTATVMWYTSHSATSQIVYGESPDCELESELDQTYTTQHVVVVGDLSPETQYHFRTRSTDSYGQTVDSDMFTFETRQDGQGANLALYLVQAQAQGPHAAAITWTTNLPSSSIVEYGTTSEYGLSAAAGEAVLKHQILLTDLSAATEYHYRVISSEANGGVVTSDDGVFTTEPAYVLVEHVDLECVAPETFTVSWTTSRPADSRVEYGTTADYGLSTETDSELVSSHSVTVSGLDPLTLYHFCVRSTDAYGYSACSGDREVTTAPPLLELAGVAVTDTTHVTATVEWSSTNPATSKVEYGLSSSYGWLVGRTELTTEHSVQISGLAPSTTYHFRVVSADAHGQETASGDLAFVTYDADYGDYPHEPPEAPPGVPEALTAEVCEDGVCLSWSANSDDDLAGYNVYRKVENDDWMFLTYIGRPSTTHTDRTAPDGAMCAYSVSAVDTYDSESDRSEAVSVTPGVSARARMWVFPNPVKDHATIRLAPPASESDSTRSSWSYTVSIYDVVGRRIRTITRSGVSGPMTSIGWDLTDNGGRLVMSGIYFCVASVPGGSARSKLIVVR